MKKLLATILFASLTFFGCAKTQEDVYQSTSSVEDRVSLSGTAVVQNDPDQYPAYSKKYIEPIGRAGMFYDSWSNPKDIDADRLLDFYGCQYIYFRKQYEPIVTVPEDEAESYIQQYFDVSVEQLHESGLYSPNEHAYIFSTSKYRTERLPSIKDITVSGDRVTFHLGEMQENAGQDPAYDVSVTIELSESDYKYVAICCSQDGKDAVRQESELQRYFVTVLDKEEKQFEVAIDLPYGYSAGQDGQIWKWNQYLGHIQGYRNPLPDQYCETDFYEHPVVAVLLDLGQFKDAMPPYRDSVRETTDLITGAYTRINDQGAVRLVGVNNLSCDLYYIIPLDNSYLTSVRLTPTEYEVSKSIELFDDMARSIARTDR